MPDHLPGLNDEPRTRAAQVASLSDAWIPLYSIMPALLIMSVFLSRVIRS
jgi:hypothetical protein